MSGWVICVFICYFIVLFSGLLRHNDLSLLFRSRTSCPGPVSCVLLFMLGSSDSDGTLLPLIFGALSYEREEEPEEGTGEMEEPL